MAFPLHGKRFGRRTVIVPPTTDMALVFPLDHKNQRFDRSFYSHYLTDGRASNEQVDGFLKEVEGAFQDKFKCLRRFRAFLVFSFVSGIFLMTMYSLLIFSGIDDNQNNHHNHYNDQQNTPNHQRNGHNRNFRHHHRRHELDMDEQIDVMFMGWGFLFFAALFWAIVYRCAKRSCFKKARRSAQDVVDRYAPVFANSGLRWNASLAFPHYIELWKDYKGQNYNQDFAQPTIQPIAQPVQHNVQPNNQVSYNAHPVSYNANPLSYNQIYQQLQTQNQNQNQRYPAFNQVVDQRAVLDFQNQGITTPLLNRHAQRSEANTYHAPYPINYVSNA